MSIDVEWAAEIKKGFSYSRPSGTKLVNSLPINIVPWQIVIADTTVRDSYELLLNDPVDMVQQIRLVGVSGGASTQRRLQIDGDNGPAFLDAVRTSTISTVPFDHDFTVTPGLNLGDGWVMRVWRDSGGVTPRRLRIKQKNLDGTPFTGDHSLTLYFNVYTTRFQ
jgi:hypothetical protein